jgi:steroid 5-alpha reductase family enzyme
VIDVFALACAAMVAVMAVSWGVQRTVKDSGWTDVFWTFGTGAVCALAAGDIVGRGHPAPWRQILVAAMAAFWSLRLGAHLALRVARGPEDARYVQLRGEWGPAFQGRMLALSLVQAPISALLATAVFLAAHAPGQHLLLGDIVGVAILMVGVAGEAVADAQLRRFKSRSGNSGDVCDVGLWAWSRHPNYFFEWTVWLAFPLVAFRSSEPVSWISLAAPAVMFLLLRFGSGVPPLEAAMVRSRGEAYRRYQARVSPLLPLPPRKRRS